LNLSLQKATIKRNSGLGGLSFRSQRDSMNEMLNLKVVSRGPDGSLLRKKGGGSTTEKVVAITLKSTPPGTVSNESWST
jgi:hypothetical protein